MGLFLSNPFKHATGIPGETVADLVMQYVVARIIATEQVGELLAQYETVRQEPDPQQREVQYIALYQAFEVYITSHKPPEVMDGLTTTRLREIIRHQFDLRLLSPEFRLAFLPETEQLLTLFSVATQKLCEYIARHLGDEELEATVHQVLGGTDLAGIIVQQKQLDMSPVLESMDNVWATNIEETLKELFQALFTKVASMIGEQYTREIVQREYSRLHNLYDAHIMQLLIDTLPRGIVDSPVEVAAPTPEPHLQSDHIDSTSPQLPNLAEEQIRLQAVMDALHMGVVLVDEQRKLLYINQAAKRLFMLQHVTLTRDAHQYTTEDVERLLIVGLQLKPAIDQCMQEKHMLMSEQRMFQGKHLRIVYSPVMKEGHVIGAIILFETDEAPC